VRSARRLCFDEPRERVDKAYPEFGNRPIAKITSQEVLAVHRTIETTGRYESAPDA
jgi:hypothetical protein